MRTLRHLFVLACAVVFAASLNAQVVSVSGGAVGSSSTVAGVIPAIQVAGSDALSPNGYGFFVAGNNTSGGNMSMHTQISTGESQSRMTLKCGDPTDFAPRLQMISGDDVTGSQGAALFDYGSRNFDNTSTAFFAMRFMPTAGAPVEMIRAASSSAVYLAHNGGMVGVGTSSPAATLHVDGDVRFDFGSPADGDALVYDMASGNLAWAAMTGGSGGGVNPGDCIDEAGMGLDTTLCITSMQNTNTNTILIVSYDGVQDGTADMAGVASLVDGGDDGTFGYGIGGTLQGGFIGVSGVDLYPADGDGFAGAFDGNVDVTGDVEANSFNIASDRKLKDNVAEINNALTGIMALQPKTYNYKADEYPQFNFDNETHYGLIAQELQTVYPEMVKQSVTYDYSAEDVRSTGVSHLSVDYVSLVPVLIAGMQEQQAIIEAQNDRIEALEIAIAASETKVNNATATPSSNKLVSVTPNPTSGATEISYNLDGATNGQIVITDIRSGAVLRTLPVSRGNGSVSFDASDLAAGVYSYTLMVDGNPVSTKKFVVTK